MKSVKGGLGGGSEQVKAAMRPSTVKEINKPQAMYTNLNEVIRSNPEQFKAK